MEVENLHNHTTTVTNAAAAAAAAAASGLASRMVTSNKPASRVPKKRGPRGGDSDDRSGEKEGNKFVGWHNASRIIRVSRVSGGKDRHSKVWTSRGPRDRRIRLSVTTAIRFYDLQDRLGYDQPSKAVEWLIKAAADPIAELPSLNNSFPATPDDNEADLDYCEEASFHHRKQQHLSLSKSSACTCSSTSDTSKGSGLSLSRTDVRVNRAKARERAKERVSSKDVREYGDDDSHRHNTTVNVSPNSNDDGDDDHDNNDTSYTALLASTAAAASAVHHFDYFNSGLLPQARPNSSSGFFGQMQLGNPFPFNLGGEHHPELQHFPVVPDHLIPVSSTESQGGGGGGGGGGHHSLNFTVSSGGGGASAGFNRGTLQSNLSSVWSPHMIQRLSPADGPNNFPFFLGGATANASASATSTALEGHAHTHQHPFPSGFDSRLLFCYGDASARHNSDQKGKGKH